MQDVDYEILENGWITPFDGYMYKRTPHLGTWNNTQKECRNWQSDLIKLAKIHVTPRRYCMFLIGQN